MLVGQRRTPRVSRYSRGTQMPSSVGKSSWKAMKQRLKTAGFKGWVSLEMEGKEPAETAVPKSLQVLRAAFA